MIGAALDRRPGTGGAPVGPGAGAGADPGRLGRVLLVTETGSAWPSGHVRARIYEPLLAQRAEAVRHACRRPPWHTRALERPGPLARRAYAFGARAAVERLGGGLASRREARIVALAREFDVVYLQKVGSWELVRALRDLPGKRLVYDLNDAVWLPRWSGFAGGRIAEILRAADAVTCDNVHTLAFARVHNPRSYLVPDPPQVERFDEARASVRKGEGSVVIGWIGSPGTAFNLFAIFEPLERLFERRDDVVLRLVGTGPGASRLPPFEQVRFTTLPDYTQDQMIREVLGMDIGLFPLFDTEDARARGLLKATVYMSGEAAAVCPPVGACEDLVQDGVNGMIARSRGEWIEKLDRLVSDAPLRRRIARAGLETVRRSFSLERCFSALQSALRGDPLP